VPPCASIPDRSGRLVTSETVDGSDPATLIVSSWEGSLTSKVPEINTEIEVPLLANWEHMVALGVSPTQFAAVAVSEVEKVKVAAVAYSPHSAIVDAIAAAIINRFNGYPPEYYKWYLTGS
jgi:hypothetical protein